MDYFEKGEKYHAWCLKENNQKTVSAVCLLKSENFSFICNKILTLKINILCLLVKFPVGVNMEGIRSSALTFPVNRLSEEWEICSLAPFQSESQEAEMLSPELKKLSTRINTTRSPRVISWVQLTQLVSSL